MKGCWVVVVALAILGVVGPAWTKPAPKLSDYSDLARQITAVMNLSADPCYDFYDYACGGWQSAFKLPADKSRFSLATDTVDTNNKNLLRAVLESSPSPPLIGPFYQSCMDMTSRNALHLSPILTRLYAIQRIGDINELFQTIGELHVLAVQSVMANIYVDADPQNPQRNLLHVMQGGVALDSPDDLSDPQLMPAYSAYVRQLFKLLDEPDEMAERHSQWAIEFEKRLANISLSPTDLRDPYTTYHLSSLRDLYATTPAIPAQAWVSYFKGAQLLDSLPHTGSALDESAQFLNIATPTFFQGLSDILAQYLKDESGWDKLRAYLSYELVNSVADHLSDPFVEAHFNFFGRTYTGQQENKPLWERCISITDGLLGDELGKYYVNKTFSAKAKAMAVDLVKRIEDAFLENLATCEWIDEPTRKLAAQKLNMIGNKIGFPDHWMDYSSLQFDTGKYMENTFAVSSFLMKRKFSQLPKPVDKSKWDMTPPTVNAYYDPSRNEMVFPAGILQSPWFFSETYPAVINFGGIGNAMGHELTHGFDDTGSLFDGNGVLHQWWPEEVRKKFDERTKCVSDLYSTYSPLPGVFVDGQLTLGENVADMGGVHEAFTAYRKYAATVKEDQVVPGLTNEQLFFVSYALSWCEVDTDEAIKRQVKSNPHSPVRYRVNGPLSQYQGFADTFKCPVGSQMNPPTKCTVW